MNVEMGPCQISGFLGKQDEATLTNYLDSQRFLQASTNASRLINKLKTALENQELYETQQIIRTIYFRFINNSEKVEALIDLLYYGALHLLERGEHISGQDIGTLFLETAAKLLQSRLDNSAPDLNPNEQTTVRSEILYHRDNETLDIDICRKISSIAVRLPDTDIGQSKFIAEALKLLPPKLLNRDLLHEVMANRFYVTKDYANARYHFLYSACTGQEVIHLLIDFHEERGVPSEVDLFITQFVLQFLCLQHPIDSPAVSLGPGQSRHQQGSVAPSNLTVSKKTRNTIKDTIRYIFLEYILRKQHPDLFPITRPYKLPLLNFTSLLISILDSGKSEADAFKFLVDTYEKAWSRDPNYQSYLNRVGVLYFGLPDPARRQQQQGSGGGSFFNNILMSLLDATDDDDGEDVAAGQQRGTLSSHDELD